MGSSTKSGTPVETRGATAAAGNQFENLFSGSFEDVLATLGIGGDQNAASGRLSTAGAQNLVGLDPDTLKKSIDNLLNPQGFDIDAFTAAQEPFRQREFERGTAGVNQSAGTFGARDSVNARDLEARSRAELSDRFVRTDIETAEAARGKRADEQVKTIAALIPSLVQAFGLNQQQGSDLFRAILQFIAPGEAIFDPGLGRELATGVVGGAASLAPIALLKP